MQYNYSVIIPYRDKYDLFLKAVDSVPDRNDIQIIIVDNAPEPLGQRDVPVKKNATVCYITSAPARGAGGARNEGLKRVEGRFLLFLDADDYFTTEAFNAFDKYISSDYDIVFFRPTSVYLSNGALSSRHEIYSSVVDDYNVNQNENRLRYRWEVPWSKLYKTKYIIDGSFIFDETRVSNDVWFSLMTGHNANKIAVDNTIVYVVTEGACGASLTMKRTKENWFIRFQVMVRVNRFLKNVGKYKYRIRLAGALRIALQEFGFKEFFHLLKYAYSERIGVL